MKLLVFSDANYASKATGRRSVLEELVLCGGACVCWFSRSPQCVTCYTKQADEVALPDIVKEVLDLRKVWRFMQPGVGMPCVPVFEDNIGAVVLAQNPFTNSNSNHIDIRDYFIRELVGRRYISVIHVASTFKHADIPTKAMLRQSFELNGNLVMNQQRFAIGYADGKYCLIMSPSLFWLFRIDFFN